MIPLTKAKLTTFILILLALLTVAPKDGSAASATDQEIGKAKIISEFDASREKVREAIKLAKSGNKEEAHRTAVAAYLEHFERVEPPLRVLDPDLTLELEDRYAAFREAIDSEAGTGKIRSEAATIHSALNEFETKVDKPSVGAGSIAFLSSFGIIFREGLEAVLILAAMLGFLKSADKRRYRKPVVIGVGSAVLASIACFFILGVLIDIAPLHRELLEAGMTVLAVIALFAVSFWLIQRIDHRHWMEFMRSRLWGATASGSALAVALVGFISVFREGFETVLFYQALLFYTGSVLSWVVAGFIVGVIALAVIAFAIFKLQKKLPIKVFMTSAVAVVMALSVAFIGNAVNQLQNLDYLPDTSLRDEMPRIPVQIAQLTGIHPTVESLAAQGALALIYIGGSGTLFVINRRRDSPTGKPQAQAS